MNLLATPRDDDLHDAVSNPSLQKYVLHRTVGQYSLTVDDGIVRPYFGEATRLDTRKIGFAPRQARYVRITSFGSKRPIYPTTFFEIEINSSPDAGSPYPSRVLPAVRGYDLSLGLTQNIVLISYLPERLERLRAAFVGRAHAMGTANLGLRRLGQAETLLRRAVKDNPDWPVPWIRSGTRCG